MKCPGIRVHCPGCKAKAQAVVAGVVILTVSWYAAGHLMFLTVGAVVMVACLLLSVALAFMLGALTSRFQGRTRPRASRAAGVQVLRTVEKLQPIRSVAPPDRLAIKNPSQVISMKLRPEHIGDRRE